MKNSFKSNLVPQPWSLSDGPIILGLRKDFNKLKSEVQKFNMWSILNTYPKDRKEDALEIKVHSFEKRMHSIVEDLGNYINLVKLPKSATIEKAFDAIIKGFYKYRKTHTIKLDKSNDKGEPSMITMKPDAKDPSKLNAKVVERFPVKTKKAKTESSE